MADTPSNVVSLIPRICCNRDKEKIGKGERSTEEEIWVFNCYCGNQLFYIMSLGLECGECGNIIPYDELQYL